MLGIIVDFPGEIEDYFAATRRLAEAVGFAKIHIFCFSPRPGTPAAVMPDHVLVTSEYHIPVTFPGNECQIKKS